MIGKLLELVFNKVKEDEDAFNKNAICVYLSDKIEQDYSIIYTYKTYERYYDKYVLNKEEIAGTPNIRLKNAFSKYLGFENYTDFKQKNRENIPKEKIQFKDKKQKFAQKNRLEKSKKDTLINPKLIKTVSLLGIVALLTYIIFTPLEFFKEKQPDTINTINIENFDARNKAYYYYIFDGKIKLVDTDNLKNINNKKTKPITQRVLNTYFHQQGKDTTTKQYKTLQANYFNKNVLPITDIEEVGESTVIPKNLIKTATPITREASITSGLPVAKEEVPTKNRTLKTTNNSLSFNILNNNTIDYKALSIFQKKHKNTYQISKTLNKKANFVCEGNTTYNYRESKRDKNRVICDFTLVYQINKADTKEIIELFNEKVKGTGFSESTAKENAIKKMALIL